MQLFPRLASFACGLALTFAVTADESKHVFDTLFAAKIKSVATTIDRADDLALAKDMLTLAKSSTDQPALLTHLCDAAHDLAARTVEGYATASEAMTLLADKVEEKRPGAREKLIAVLTKQSSVGKSDEREAAGEALIALLTTTGDEKLEKKQNAEAAADYRRAMTIAHQKKSASLEVVKAKMEFALSRDRIMKQLSRLQEKLLKDADSATADEIIKIYVLELDEPAGAKPYLDRSMSVELKAMVPLAMKSLDELKADEALQLGEWYRLVATDSKYKLLRTPLQRARNCFTRFLELHTAKDLTRVKVEGLIKEIEADDRFVAEPITPSGRRLPKGKPVDVLKLIDLAKDKQVGKWESRAGALYIPRSEGAPIWRVDTPVLIKGNYELTIEFKRHVNFFSGIAVTLPIGDSNVALLVGGCDHTGLGDVDGKSLWENPTGKKVEVPVDKSCTLTIAVAERGGKAAIAVQLDKNEIHKWTGDSSSLRASGNHAPPDLRQLAVGAYEGGITFIKVELRVMEGLGEVTR